LSLSLTDIIKNQNQNCHVSKPLIVLLMVLLLEILSVDEAITNAVNIADTPSSKENIVEANFGVSIFYKLV